MPQSASTRSHNRRCGTDGVPSAHRSWKRSSGHAARNPGRVRRTFSSYTNAHLRIYIFVRIRMCATGYIHTGGKGGRDRIGAGSPNIGRRPSWPVITRGKFWSRAERRRSP